MTVALLDRHTDNDPLNKTDPLGLRPMDDDGLSALSLRCGQSGLTTSQVLVSIGSCTPSVTAAVSFVSRLAEDDSWDGCVDIKISDPLCIPQGFEANEVELRVCEVRGLSCSMLTILSNLAGLRTQLLYGGTGGGGEQNAFQHIYWGSLLTVEFGTWDALLLLVAHEMIPDNPPAEMIMDLHNDGLGVAVGLWARGEGYSTPTGFEYPQWYFFARDVAQSPLARTIS